MTLCITQDAKAADTSRDDLWGMAVVGRLNKPPLRFKGQRVAHVSRTLAPNLDIFIEVWMRKKGDCVVAYSDVVGTAIKPDALVLADLSDVADYLEDLGQRPTQPMSQAAFPQALTDILQSVGFQQQFIILIGDLLAVLDPFCPPRADIASQKENDHANR